MASNSPRPSKADRLEAARAQARATRDAAEKKRRQRSLWIKIGVIVAAVAVVAGGIGIYVSTQFNPNNTVAKTGPVPANANQYGGVVNNGPNQLAESPADTPQEINTDTVEGAVGKQGEPTKPQGANDKANPAQVIVYVDLLCPFCKQFEDTNAALLETYVKDKKATVEYRMVTFLDRASSTNYPSRGANAMACVANEAPAAYMPFMKSLWKAVDEGLVNEQSASSGLTNAQLGERAVAAGAPDSVKSCIENGTYRPWVKLTTGLAQQANVQGTPSVLINGETYTGAADSAEAFKAFADEKIAAAAKK
ncbi:DsbA family protein [Galactobacter caseinivorans]|uniref:Thioredoxin-like fold domain-containing protein n=1 Tax=Galactobacter caseinivorans TaxID=2676123 RepID=A0A496PFP0_9MICC|nr:thioredoxin domain-containing protein [Galactobacter caseinivorans]RKW69426.1 hypothetical protein DWQ67_12750 [Galactobacter caseinivorans]